MPDPFMGFALQSIAPPAQPYAVPDAAPLVALGRPANPTTNERQSRDTEVCASARPMAECEAHKAFPAYRV